MASGFNIKGVKTAVGYDVLDQSGNIIFSVDGVNRKMSFPSGSELEVASGATFDPATALFEVYLADGQDETMDTTITVTGLAATDKLCAVLVLATKASIATVTKRAITDYTVSANTLTVAANAADTTNNQYVIFAQKI